VREHELKIWPDYFEPVADGRKPFELRKDDRGYEVGDVLVLRAWDGAYMGPVCRVRVTYVLRNVEGLAPDYVVLGIAVLP